MGTSTPAGFSRKLVRLAGELEDLPHSVVEDASLTSKRIIKGIAPARLRGVGKRGAKLDVAYNIMGRGVETQSLVFARGPWQLIEWDTSAHQIPRVRGPRARARYAVFGGGVYSRVAHPGTRGQHPWAKGSEVARAAAAVIFRAKGALAIRKIF